MITRCISLAVFILLLFSPSVYPQFLEVGDTVGEPFSNSPVVTDGATLEVVSTGHAFTEGPVVDKDGNLFFTDQSYHVITKITPTGERSAFVNNTGDANGLFFDPNGVMISCLSGDRMVVSIDNTGRYTVIADAYNGKRFNCCNDLWIDPAGGIYFSDPAYNINLSIEQDGEHVYYIPPSRDVVIRVTDDLERPNGIIGTPDGKTLYITDEIARIVYKYSIESDGKLSNKTLFCRDGLDGMTMDVAGNVYLAAQGIRIYSPDGDLLETIPVPENPTNVAFGGPDRKTLYITAQTSVYSIRMDVAGRY